jgi:hypothetical protein
MKGTGAVARTKPNASTVLGNALLLPAESGFQLFTP